MLDDAERALNFFADNDAEWWPFLFLRPKTDERMRAPRVAQLAVLHGLPLGLLGDASLAVAHHRAHPAILPAAAIVALFAIFQLTIAWAWNRRADRLAADRERT